MTDDMDIENELRRFQHDPGPEVRRSVLARFTSRFEGRGPGREKIVLWTKPIPLYVAIVGLIIAVTSSFLAGQRMALSKRPLEASPESAQIENASWTQEVKWEVAPNDLM